MDALAPDKTMTNSIRAHRQRIGLTTHELAVALGVTGALVAIWERGELFPPDRRLRDLARLLGIDEVRLRSDLTEFRARVTRRVHEKLAAVT